MNKKRLLSGALALTVLIGNFGVIPIAGAAAPGDVVISEVAWAGSVDSANDEYIELYNTSGVDVDLSGWTILDDGVPSYSLSGTIRAHSYFLIEDAESVVNPYVADLIAGLSLANTGDSLVLQDDSLNVIDTVNSTGGMWFAGDSVLKASMERVDLMLDGDNAANWVSSTGAGSSATASLASLIVGTPGLQNSVCNGAECGTPSGAAVSLNVSAGDVFVGEMITVTVDASEMSDLFSYGVTITYDPAVLQFSTAVNGGFLSESGSVSSSFQFGLENGIAGRLVVAEARTIDPKVGVSGSGDLFSLMFDVVGGEGSQTLIGFDVDSFVADTAADFVADFNDLSLDIAVASADPVTGLVAGEDAERYAIVLNWTGSANATSYRVMREDQHGVYVLLGETSELTFIDNDLVVEGGKLIPNRSYNYRLIAVRSGVESAAVDVSGMETRGLTGDNDRSDRVDGRDLDNLARQFALVDTDSGFDALVDTTYDGMIDGSDLIDLGANFALTY